MESTEKALTETAVYSDPQGYSPEAPQHLQPGRIKKKPDKSKDDILFPLGVQIPYVIEQPSLAKDARKLLFTKFGDQFDKYEKDMTVQPYYKKSTLAACLTELKKKWPDTKLADLKKFLMRYKAYIKLKNRRKSRKLPDKEKKSNQNN